MDDSLQAAFSDYEIKDFQFGKSWLSNLAANALDDDEQAVIFIARHSPENFVAFPMKLKFSNGHASSLSTFYSSIYSPIVCSSSPGPLFIALFRYLARVERVTTITLSPMDVDSPVFNLLLESLAQGGWNGIHSFFCFGNWTHDVDGASYSTYFVSRASQLRNTITRKTRQFLDGGRGRLDIITDGSELEAGIEHFVAVYNQSWKQREPYPGFIPQLLRLSAQRGWLRLGIARYDGKPVAGQIWLVWKGTAYIFKLAYHEDYKQLSSGTILTAHLMEYVIDRDAVTKIDYLSGDDDYKKAWMSMRSERHGIAAYNPRTLHGTAMRFGHAINGLLKKSIFRPTPTASHGSRD